MTHILITDLREIRYMAYVPERVKRLDYAFQFKYDNAIAEYNAALEKAKRESLPFEDLDLITLTIAEHLFPDTYTIGDIEKFRQDELKPGIYQVPVEVEIVEIVNGENFKVTMSTPFAAGTDPTGLTPSRKVARILQGKEVNQ